MSRQGSHDGVLDAWHGLVAAWDLDRLPEVLDENVVFFSPVVHTPRTGKKRTLIYLEAACRVFLNESFRYTREFRCDGGAVLEFTLELDGTVINGVDILRWNSEQKITEFKVMIRPLKAINLIHSRMSKILKTVTR